MLRHTKPGDTGVAEENILAVNLFGIYNGHRFIGQRLAEEVWPAAEGKGSLTTHFLNLGMAWIFGFT